MTLAHVGGLPIEETLVAGGPALFALVSLLAARVRFGARTRGAPDGASRVPAAPERPRSRQKPA